MRANAADVNVDVVIVGAGAAGLSAALTLTRARRCVTLVDDAAPRNAPAEAVHGYLGREGAPPAQLLADGRAEVAAYGGRFLDGTVVAAERVGDAEHARWCVHLADERSVCARRLLVTTGLVDELPHVAGLAERWGRDVLHCPYCHGWEVRDRVLGVLGTGPVSVGQALLFRQWSDRVIFLRHAAPEPTGEQREQLASRGIAIVDGEVATVVTAGDRLTGVELRDGDVVSVQALAVAPRFTARAGWLSSLPLEPVEQFVGDIVIGTAIPADAAGRTSVAGVYVAGNITNLTAQVLTAAAGGQLAGAAINADLLAEDTHLSVAAYRRRKLPFEDAEHVHTQKCWWKPHEARWQCDLGGPPHRDATEMETSTDPERFAQSFPDAPRGRLS